MNKPLDYFDMLERKVEEAIKAFDRSVVISPNEIENGADKIHGKRGREEDDQNANKKQKQS